jgi:hypothetical protein
MIFKLTDFQEMFSCKNVQIRKIEIRIQHREIVLETLSQKHPTQKKDWQSGSTGRAPA